MTAWAWIVQQLQFINGLIWLYVGWRCFPAVWAAWRSEITKEQLTGVPLFGIAVAQVGFILRWLTFPRSLIFMSHLELQVWAMLYLVNGLSALTIVYAYRNIEGS